MTRLVGTRAPLFSLEALAEDGERFTRISLSDYLGKWLVLFFYPMDFTFVCPTELTAFSDARESFRSAGAELLAVSTDSVYSHLAWVRNGLGKLGYPMGADRTGRVCADYGVLLEEEGISLRGLFLIDPEQTVRYGVIHDNKVGRNPQEVLRVLHALETDELCAAGWSEGDSPLRPALPAQEASSERASQPPGGIRVYTMPGCGYCRSVKAYLKEAGLSYQEIDLSTDLQGQEFMALRKYRALPVTVIGGVEIEGFDMPKIRAALNGD